MFTPKKSFICAAATVAALLSSTAMAGDPAGLNDNKTLRSSNSEIVTSQQHGTCVRTEWEAGTNVCAPNQATAIVTPPKPQPVVQTVLSTEEKTVYFDFDSSVLSAASQSQLDSVARKLSGAKDIQSADIVGYADRIGSSSYNENLSRRRAEVVKDYLAARGYLNTQVAEVRGLGEANARTSCDTSLPREEQISCLSADRRVEVEVKYLEDHTVINH